MICRTSRHFLFNLALPLVLALFVILPMQASPGRALENGATADYVVVEKSRHRMTLYRDGRKLKSYSVSLGKARGPKEYEGDKRTPEGVYIIDSRKEDSDFHRALHISYPNPDDVKRAKEQGKEPGGSIMIHGLPDGKSWWGRFHLLRDWTAGCIAVTNSEIREIWNAVPDGTPIEIKP